MPLILFLIAVPSVISLAAYHYWGYKPDGRYDREDAKAALLRANQDRRLNP